MNDKTSVFNKILEIVNSVIADQKIEYGQADKDLSQFGMDSMKFIHTIVALEEEFEIEIPDEKLLFAEMGTLSKIVDVVSTALGIMKD